MIPGYSLYEVSNLGKIRRVANKRERKLTPSFKGDRYYLIVNLRGDNTKNRTRDVHQLVAMAFLGHTPNGHEIIVDHKNNDSTDNRVSNLQLVSNRVNSSKDREGNLPVGVSINKNSVKNPYMSRIQINGKRTYLGSFATVEEASKAYEAKLLTLN